jgi:hypothetical protein
MEVSILFGGAPKSEPGSSADAIEIIVVIIDDVLEAHERKQAPIERDTFLEVGYGNIDVSDSVDFHADLLAGRIVGRRQMAG